jgi:hypothetical protein
MPVAGSTYWNMVHGCEPGEVKMDAEGMQTMRNLAKNLAWMMKCFEAGKVAGVPLPVKKLIHAVSVMDFTYAREPVLLLLETVVTTAVFGRYYCGYICSFGAAQDLSYDLGNLIRKQTKYRKKRMLSVKTDKILAVLSVFLIRFLKYTVFLLKFPIENGKIKLIHIERDCRHNADSSPNRILRCNF